MQIASVEGLEGVTIGRLAGDLEMSKAGILGQVGSKTELQLMVLDAAAGVFARAVWDSAAARPAGLSRLVALCDAWVAHIASQTFAGGCFWTAASTEFDTREGAVHDRVADQLEAWRWSLRAEIRTAIKQGELEQDTDVDQVVFELQSTAMGLNQAIQLFGDKRAAARARRAMRRAIGVGDSRS